MVGSKGGIGFNSLSGKRSLSSITLLFVLLAFFASKPSYGQEKTQKDGGMDSLRNAVGIELLGRDLFNFYSLAYRLKLGRKRRHWLSLNWSARILKPSEMTLAATYSFIPLKVRAFKLKPGIGISQNFALGEKPGASVDPRKPDRPFYRSVIFGELGFYFTLSPRFSLEANYIPGGYWLKDELGKKNSFKEGLRAHNSWIWGGIQINYKF